jgi:hypothetical protein
MIELEVQPSTTCAHVSVAGSVVNGVTIGTRSFGTAIEEHNHHIEN